MKSEHRHELKTNELAEWLANLPQWTKENLKTVIYVSVVIVLVVGAYFWNKFQKKAVATQSQLTLTGLIIQSPQTKARIVQAQDRDIDISDTLLQEASRLAEIAGETKNDQMAALALIKQAELLRSNLHYRLGEVGEVDFSFQINRAKTSYTQAIEKAWANTSLMAIAKVGLGLCEEELKNFDKARQIYDEVASESKFDGTVAQAQARRRIETMDLFKKEVVLKASPNPTPGPQVEPAPFELTQP